MTLTSGLPIGFDLCDTSTLTVVWELHEGWPENTDPQSVDPPYGPVHRALLQTPPHPCYGPPKKIAEKENKQI